ncbi:MAG: hypothetical protein MPEBLZ_03001 [Candidatus Methanoperedens nitroreducens]|uniref:DUF6036 domain-containing protein n=1 Tax=Candidatus Methanoperedens nitratireducens TaxID=1392998 RepID=A0A0P8DXJ7_9EURY|nr:DUF6036 family nucleotidyltransferase [Candidatus Methanoperedens sp. BLZ2]KPQ42422.1 MAG: hypothetical protein MPEBLZ_03001 [Candidatus Methanoperedens sp. BLZ1]MBZ0174849.1 hypothetical protein [Candidatus Methanoperedens nitroreducens]MCX9086444.1 DUF6036 family nucleotidyltransferase [Candidatus Methanoperedens sp.]CAG0958672.1 hypothetical protein METP2_00654 [Methanosarcinales archaeon]
MDRKQGNGAKIITTELKKISSIENLVDRKIYFMGLLTREAEKRHVQPIVVGGSAVDFYTEGIYPSYDIDLVSDRKVIGEILEHVFDFKQSGKNWINEQIGLYVEVPGSHLAGDKDKVMTIKIENLKVYVIGIEDLIIDRLNACVHWKSQRDCDQAQYMIRYYRDRVDFEYLEKKARDEVVLNKFRELCKE